jgi:phosphoglycerate dehydrogenase-like enzyme
MSKPVALITAWLPDGALPWLTREFPEIEFADGRDTGAELHLLHAAVWYGLPPAGGLGNASLLRWVQLPWAGVPQELCEAIRNRNVSLTNMAGLYGPSIAEQALALMAITARNLQLAVHNQVQQRWDREMARTMTDLSGQTLAVIGLGNIGQSIARLARGYGMRIVGCRRTGKPAPLVDQVYPLAELHALLAEGDYVAVAAPLTRHTEGMLGRDEFRAIKRGAIYINVSRGGIAQEPALLDALQTGQLRAAGLDVFTIEPLPAGHPLWSMPQVVISPHCSGETVNWSSLPVQRFARNLRSWLAGRRLEGVVNLEWGY